MIWKRWFGKQEKKEASPDPLHDLSLDKLQPGYLVDYDMKTWEVVTRNRYVLGEDGEIDEWELRSGNEVIFLNREMDDDVYWTVTQKIPLGSVDPTLREHILKEEDPPERIRFEGVDYFMESYGGGEFYPGNGTEWRPFLFWDYEDDQGRLVLTIEQWGDTEFEAVAGMYVEEYQFSHILPGRKQR